MYKCIFRFDFRKTFQRSTALADSSAATTTASKTSSTTASTTSTTPTTTASTTPTATTTSPTPNTLADTSTASSPIKPPAAVSFRSYSSLARSFSSNRLTFSDSVDYFRRLQVELKTPPEAIEEDPSSDLKTRKAPKLSSTSPLTKPAKQSSEKFVNLSVSNENPKINMSRRRFSLRHLRKKQKQDKKELQKPSAESRADSSALFARPRRTNSRFLRF